MATRIGSQGQVKLCITVQEIDPICFLSDDFLSVIAASNTKIHFRSKLDVP